jgi:hypothetical protein
MGTDPFEGATHHTSDRKFKRGDRITHPRIGECSFYKHDLLRQKIEVFDTYGILRYIPDREVEQCQPMKNRES